MLLPTSFFSLFFFTVRAGVVQWVAECFSRVVNPDKPLDFHGAPFCLCVCVCVCARARDRVSVADLLFSSLSLLLCFQRAVLDGVFSER